jgi:hypothetical protein
MVADRDPGSCSREPRIRLLSLGLGLAQIRGRKFALFVRLSAFGTGGRRLDLASGR